ncbi:MAG: type ISP restriction/modification enzyme [Desulfobacterales bacterium]
MTGNFEKKYNVRNSSGYNLLQRMAKSKYSHSKIRDITYRPFDVRKIYYDEKLVSRAGYESNRHLLKPNLGLIVKRGFDQNNSAPCFISRFISDRRGWTRPGMQGAESVFPLYFYPEAADMADTEQKAMRKPNLNKEIVQKIADKLALQFSSEKKIFGSDRDRQDTFAPIDILDYIYAVLHSPSYREKYKEFLKIDFPRVPYPKDAKTFWQLAKLGGELRQLHLLESTVPEKRTAAYPQPGENIVEKIRFENSRVWINKQQYFDKVPQTAWEFWIGGYQPAQKWLKDRKGRKLNFDDIVHYQKIITTLSETDRIMKKTDRIDVFGT